VIKTNLSTRPFYNERAVHLALIVLAVIVVGTAFHFWRKLAGRIDELQEDLQSQRRLMEALRQRLEHLEKAAAPVAPPPVAAPRVTPTDAPPPAPPMPPAAPPPPPAES